MRRHLGFLASLLLLLSTALIWTGCSDSCCLDSCDVVSCQEQSCEGVQPANCCEPLCRVPVKCCHPSNNELCCVDGITVRARNPEMCMLGDQYPLEFYVEACDDVCDVVVSAELPEGVTYVRSEPAARVEGKKLTWEFGKMHKGECRPATVYLECECEGELCACFCASAVPVRFCSLLCAKPILVCQKCGPEEVCPGDPVNYTVTVTNRGSCTAHDVVVTDNVPDGLVHASGQRTLTFKLGSLEPCETKKVNMCFCAEKLGEVCNTVVVSSCNADSTSCQWCTCVCCCDVEINKVGPKEQQLGKNADYQITVQNTGNKAMHDVVVTDCAPSATSIVAANGAMINCNQAVWRLKELAAGEKVNFTITLTTCTPGCFTNRVSVNSCEGCCDSAEFTTRWRGRPALNVCICDTEDPICIGDPTSYCITVTNQGSEPDDNVQVVVRFPPEIVPVSATGDVAGRVSGNTVVFDAVDNFGPRQTLKYRVDARGNQSGDGRVVAEVTSNAFQTPIVQQESTVVH